MSSEHERNHHREFGDSHRVEWENLPPLLKVWPEVAQILRVNRTRAYELLPSLPGVVRLGKRQYRVSRDALRRWADGAAS